MSTGKNDHGRRDTIHPPSAGGVVHTYQGYDPQRFPMPGAANADLVSSAFEHMLAYGSLRRLSEADLANAVEIDPSRIRGLGPSIESLLAILEERKRRILETYETETARAEADRGFRNTAALVRPPHGIAKAFEKAVRDEQIADLERIWYRADQRGEFARSLVGLMEALGRKYEVEALASRYAFKGRKEMGVEKAIAIKEELETIDRLIEQLKQAAKNAKVYMIDMEALARFADEEQVGELDEIRRRVAEMLERLAEEQGLRRDGDGYRLTPKAMRIFQGKLLGRIFAELKASRSGRHEAVTRSEGSVEIQRTKAYEFGDSLANMDVTGSVGNAVIREARERGELKLGDGESCQTDRGQPITPIVGTGKLDGETAGIGRVRLMPQDIEIHLTRNSPKCASVVCMDMSGSMRWGGAYIQVKQMALALNGLIRREYPGDYLEFVEVASLPRRRHISEIPELLPKPVTIHEPWVRLKADLGDERIGEGDIPPHFTNIQRGLAMARQLLTAKDTPNRQVILITDGLPTAHFEGRWLYLLYPPDPRTERATLREGMLCRDAGITINIFLLSSWSQCEEDVQFAHRLAEQTGGRVFFVGGRELDRYVVWDYVQRRRLIIG